MNPAWSTAPWKRVGGHGVDIDQKVVGVAMGARCRKLHHDIGASGQCRGKAASPRPSRV